MESALQNIRRTTAAQRFVVNLRALMQKTRELAILQNNFQHLPEKRK